MAFPTDWQVPAFEERRFRDKNQRYCVLVFVINEGERVRRQLQKMKPLAATVDLVVADGGSTDGSLDPAFLREHGLTALLTKRGSGRLSAQMRMGLAWAMNDGYEGAVVVDGNDKDDTAAVSLFIEALDAGVDHAQGSRYVPGGHAINTPLLRHLGVILLHAPLISLAAGFRYTDTTNGFRAYSRRLLLDARVQPFRDVFMAYELHYYLAIRAARLGFRVAEVPVTRQYPQGPMPTKISGWSGYWSILKTLGGAVSGRWNPQSR